MAAGMRLCPAAVLVRIHKNTRSVGPSVFDGASAFPLAFIIRFDPLSHISGLFANALVEQLSAPNRFASADNSEYSGAFAVYPFVVCAQKCASIFVCIEHCFFALYHIYWR